jgi:hypothetical protein
MRGHPLHVSVTSTTDVITKVIIKRSPGSRNLFFTVDDFTFSYARRGPVTIRSSILENSKQNCSGNIVSQGENLVSDKTCGGASSDILGKSGARFSDPGIPGWGHWALPSGSPAIGKSRDCPRLDLSLHQGIDQLGQPRFQGRKWEPAAVTCDIGAVEFEPVVNSSLTFDRDPTTYEFTSDASGCPVGYAGVFSFDAQLANKKESGRWLTDLLVSVHTLTGGGVCLSGQPCGNMLQTGQGLGNVGSRQIVNLNDDYADGWLAPGDSVRVHFDICLQEQEPFDFFVDVLSTAITQDPATLCHNVSFDPATQCCASGSVIGKHDITKYNLNVCTDRVANPTWIASEHVNGCGPADPNFFQSFVPENPNIQFGGPSFTPACNKHDECYGTCGANKNQCDTQFFVNLKELCYDASINNNQLQVQKYNECFENTRRYSGAVRKYGEDAYLNAQAESCLCCP